MFPRADGSANDPAGEQDVFSRRYGDAAPPVCSRDHYGTTYEHILLSKGGE